MANSFVSTDCVRASGIRCAADGCDHYSLLNAYREAKARFELESLKADQDAESEFCREHTAALNSFMLTPAASISHLAEKLAIYQAEDLHEWYLAEPMFAMLVADARRLSYAQK